MGGKKPRVIFAGSEENEQKVIHILDSGGWKYEYCGRWLSMENLLEKIKTNQITDLIFSADDCTASQIIQSMTLLGNEDIRFRLFPKNSNEIIGSHSKNTLADLFTLNLDFAIQQPVHQRIKRIFDSIVALLLFLLGPVVMFQMRHRKQFYKNILKVILGKKSWVGYCRLEDYESSGLPKIKEGILNPSCLLDVQGKVASNLVNRINLNYAKDYNVYQDFLIMIKDWQKLDGSLFSHES